MDLVTKQAPASQQDHAEVVDEVPSCRHEAPPTSEAFSIQSLPTAQCNISVVCDQLEKSEVIIKSKSLSAAESSSCMIRSAERTYCQRDLLCVVGSSKCLNASMKRLYRSRNVPVQRPLPSLVGLLESAKRVKMRPSSNYSSLNSWRTLPYLSPRSGPSQAKMLTISRARHCLSTFILSGLSLGSVASSDSKSAE